MKYTKEQKMEMRKVRNHGIRKRFNSVWVKSSFFPLNYTFTDEAMVTWDVVDKAVINDNYYLLAKSVGDNHLGVFKLVSKRGELVRVSNKKLNHNRLEFTTPKFWENGTGLEISDTGKLVNAWRVFDMAVFRKATYFLAVGCANAEYAVFKEGVRFIENALSKKQIFRNSKAFSNPDSWKLSSILNIDDEGTIQSVRKPNPAFRPRVAIDVIDGMY